ncbi:MAG: hypothetical protein HQ555_02350 [Candidatus Aminicenantes bacterium]|nr:hypothetical protein [Candidatus Aminicenantes bacterium]
MMELHDVYSMRMKLEDALIEIKLWEPQRKELNKEKEKNQKKEEKRQKK